MEDSLSMPELTSLLIAKREDDHNNKKFFAAIQGINLDEAQAESNRGQKEWEDLKARVFSRGQTNDSNDIVSLQGINAETAGFGIGAGLDYEVVKDPKNPFG